MLDYVIAIVVAVVGLAVMYFIFSSISSADVSMVSHTAANRKPRSKKQAKGPSRRYKEDVLDQETERLIAEEVAKTPSGLSTDTRIVEPTTLEELRRANRDRETRKAAVNAPKDTVVSERQRRIDKELGFHTVGVKEKKEKKQKQKEAEQTYSAADEEDMDRKLANFFRNSKNRSRQTKINVDEEAPTTGTGTGGRVAIKGDLSNARTWQ